MNKTAIEYVTHSWNPLAMRCSKVSAGCANCWHLRMADRHMHNPTFSDVHRRAYAGKSYPVLKDPDAPLRRRKPAIIAVQFMGDLFHEGVNAADIDEVFSVMEQCQQHTFVLLTKRPQNAGLYFAARYSLGGGVAPDKLWLGVTVENQETADERIPQLLQIPAAHRWVSYEPALEAVALHYWFHGAGRFQESTAIEFVVAGGESGPGARPAHPDWFRSARDQCAEAGVPFMFKQWGEYVPCYEAVEGWWCRSDIDGNEIRTRIGNDTKVIQRKLDDFTLARLGKKKAGRMLDGREHLETPWEMP